MRRQIALSSFRALRDAVVLVIDRGCYPAKSVIRRDFGPQNTLRRLSGVC